MGSRLALLVVPILVIAACGGSQPATPSATAAATAAASAAPTATSTAAFIAKLYEDAKKDGTFTWYAQTDEKIVNQFTAAFAKTYPGVKVEYLQLSDATQRLIAENKANQLSIDLFKPTLDYEMLKKEGLVADMTEILLAAGVKKEQLYEGLHQDEFLVSGVAYNPDKVKGADIPKKWDDLLDAKFKGRIAIDDRLRPFVNATPFWGEAKVVDYLTKLKAQNVKARSGESAVTALMFAGETDITIGAFLGSLNENKGKPWAFAPLDEVYSIVAINGWTVPPKAKHQAAARLFLYWYESHPDSIALRDQLRFRGDPRPGTGTGPSKYLEQNKIAVKVAPIEYDLNFRSYQVKYLQALGLPVN
jgi:iron(III) transport system substrate-binding protein